MKKYLFIVLCIFSLFAFSCGEKKVENQEPVSEEVQVESEEEVIVPAREVTFQDVQKATSPVYEEISSFDGPVYKRLKSKKRNYSSDKKSESVIPGVRNLSEYKAAYSETRKELEYSVIDEVDDTNKKVSALTITEWGPTQNYNPQNGSSIYFVFSKPMRSLGGSDEILADSDIFTITPPLKGHYRWFGANQINYEAEESVKPDTNYVIKFNKNIKALDGSTFDEEKVFNIKTTPIEIKVFEGGYISGSSTSNSWSEGILPPYENRFYTRLNYLLSEKEFRDNLVVTVGKQKVSYNLELEYTKSAFYWRNPEPKSDKNKRISNSFIVTITDPVPHNTEVSLIISKTKEYKKYQTLSPFTVDYVSSVTEFGTEGRSNPLYISFSHPVDKNTIADNISFDFDYKLTSNNFSVNDSYLTIYNLPIKLSERHQIKFGNGLKDIYGQSIKLYDNLVYNFSTRVFPSYVKFIDEGMRIMEAQFPHKLYVEHKNIKEGGNYTIRKVSNPLFRTYKDWSDPLLVEGSGDSGFVEIKPGVLNSREFEEIDLNPYLNNGYGFVLFQANVPQKDYDYNTNTEKEYRRENSLVIQVTDLGVSARIGLNKAVVMVRNLNNNKPVEGAKVHLCVINKDMDSGSNLLNSEIAYAETDSKGFAVINYTKEQFEKYKNDVLLKPSSDSVLYVESDNDQVVFIPDTHDAWREGIYIESQVDALRNNFNTFMFVDRGIYRPGEIAKFRGIDKNLLMGGYDSYVGPYLISFYKGGWRTDQIDIPQISGKTSKSGGFWGSFKIPENLEPGEYKIVYRRGNSPSSSYTSELYFTVANFEKAKFQSSITIPSQTYFGGDTITGELFAEYLSGGSLAGAEFETSWQRQATSVYSSAPEAKGYIFASDYSSRNYFRNEKGVLSNKGTANISCKTEEIKDAIPYTYRVEASITDESNQQLTVSNSVLVNSSHFYVGLKEKEHGFGKKDTKMEIPYILINPEGNVLTDKDARTLVKSLKYELSREVWTMVNEQSVNSSIYTRYQRSNVIEKTGDVYANASGKISITPQNAGWYTLKVTGKDYKDCNVKTSIEFFVTGGNYYRFDEDNANSIKLTPDKAYYKAGDKAEILVESPLPQGDYLVTVEREGIFTEEIIHLDNPSDVIEVPVAINYAPVVYVSIASYSQRTGAPKHKYGEVDLDKPAGFYGVTSLNVLTNSKAFTVNIESDKEEYKPGEEVTLKLSSTHNGKALSNAELTVMVVDRGVLDVIDYHVSNPVDKFYNRYNFPLRVDGGDSRDYLMDPVTYSIKDLQGGDSDTKDENLRSDFDPTAYFEPAVFTDKNGEVVCKFKLPDNLTTYRITVVGSQEDLFALSENEIRATNELNISQVQPRKLRVRDTAECGVLITNLTEEEQEVTVTLDVVSPAKNTVKDEKEGRVTVPGIASVDGKNQHTVNVVPGKSSVVYFDVLAEKAGTVELTYSIESKVLNEKLVSQISIENSYSYETQTLVGEIEGKNKGEATAPIVIPSFATDGRGEVSISLDATRLGLLKESVDYVFNYPYGCLEQQSAGILPLIVFDKYIDAFELNNKVSDIKKCVTTYTKRWGLSQLKDGSFPYWPEGKISNDFVTSRIALIAALALEKGYTEDELGIEINPLIQYMNYALRNYRQDDNWNPQKIAFIYSLKKLDKDFNPDSIKFNLTDASDIDLSDLATLGIVFASSKNQNHIDTAQEIAKLIESYLIPEGRLVSISKKSSNYSYWYSSDIKEMANILKFLVTLNPNNPMVDRLIFTLLNNMSTAGYWENTSSTASVLEAISVYIKQRNLDKVNLTGNVLIDGKNVLKQKMSGVTAKPATLVLPFEDEILSNLNKDTKIPVSITKKGKGNLYYTVSMKTALPDEMQTKRDAGINVDYTISEYNSGVVINKGESPVVKLTSGKLYKATIKLNSTKNRNYLALRCPIPSGASIVDESLANSRTVINDDSDYSFSRQAIMDNEMQYFWNNLYPGQNTVSFVFRAERRGVYPVPPVLSECMYTPEIYGRSDGYLFVIE